MQLGLHVRQVVFPLAARRTVVKGVGIGVQHDALELAQDHAAQHVLQFRVLTGILDVRPHLGTAVAQPHRMDVARIDKRVVLAILVQTVVDRAVERVGEAVHKHPCQARIALDLLVHVADALLDNHAGEQALLDGRPFAHIG